METIVQAHGTNQYQLEEQKVIEHVKTFTPLGLSQLKKRQQLVNDVDLVVGNLSFIKEALRIKGLKLPPENCYPSELMPYMYRKIGTGLLKQLPRYANTKIFVKPANNCKRFTGIVTDDVDDYRLQGISRNEFVWFCEVVNWRSEWRFYVQDHNVVFRAPYAGTVLPNLFIVNDMIQRLEHFTDLPSTYALDVGVLSSGKTALVEVNDAYAIGGYGNIPADIYTNWLLARWKTLVL